MPVQSIRESFTIQSNVKRIKKISSKIVDLLIDRGADKDHIFDIRLCVEEAIINAIEHGNKGKEDLTVDISLMIDDEKAEITVEDKGIGFKHLDLPDPTKDKNILRNHGRGIYLIHKLMDKVEYNDKGTRIKMTKFLK